MIEHHLQKKIIAALVESQGARFAELRPAAVEANAFTYHLQQVVKAGWVEKSADGRYRLTPTGKLLGVSASLSRNDQLLQAHAIVLLAVRDGRRWLLRRRLVQPLYGQIGFIHGEPVAGEPLAETAAAILARRTGLAAADFTVRGSGFIVGRSGGEVESYVQFVLMEAVGVTGELVERDGHGQNLWLDQPDFAAADMVGSMAELAPLVATAGPPFFVELVTER